MTDELIAVRFPVPRREILEQIPGELRGLYGGRETAVEPEKFSDEVDYVYLVKRPDGSPFEALLYCEYRITDGPPVAFIAGDHVELDGVLVEVVNYELFREGVAGDGRRYWRVLVRPPRGEDNDG